MDSPLLLLGLPVDPPTLDPSVPCSPAPWALILLTWQNADHKPPGSSCCWSHRADWHLHPRPPRRLWVPKSVLPLCYMMVACDHSHCPPQSLHHHTKNQPLCGGS